MWGMKCKNQLSRNFVAFLMAKDNYSTHVGLQWCHDFNEIPLLLPLHLENRPISLRLRCCRRRSRGVPFSFNSWWPLTSSNLMGEKCQSYLASMASNAISPTMSNVGQHRGTWGRGDIGRGNKPDMYLSFFHASMINKGCFNTVTL